MKPNGVYLTIPEENGNSTKEQRKKYSQNPKSLSESEVRPMTQTQNTQGNGASALTQWCRLVTAISTGSIEKDRHVDFEGQAFIKRYSAYSNISLPSHLHQKYDDLYRRNSRGSKAFGKFGRRIFSHRTVFRHDSTLLFYWLSILALAVFYNWWSLIVREAFPLIQTQHTTLWAALDAVADLAFLCDILIQIRTGYLQEGLLVTSVTRLMRHYMFSFKFALDVLCMIPGDYVFLWISGDYHPIGRIARLIKIHRVMILYYMTETRTVWPNLNRVASLSHILLLSCHWLACIYYMIIGGELAHVVKAKDKDDEDVLRLYLGALYWSTLTLTTIGNNTIPRTKIEYIFSIVSYLLGVFVFATIVGQVGNVINNRNASRLQFERLLDGAKHYMRNHRVPEQIYTKVLRWYDYAWSRGRMTGGTDIESLSLLPEKLKMELALHVNISTLKKVSIFGDCEAEFLRDLVLKMRAMIFTPGDFVCRKGEIAREMYIIADGVLQVLDSLGGQIREMRSGEVFGEIGILNLDCNFCKRTADVRSLGYSEMFCLSREDILATLQDYPSAEACLRSHGEKRLCDRSEVVSVVPPVVTLDSDSTGAIEANTGDIVIEIPPSHMSLKSKASFQSRHSVSLDVEMVRSASTNFRKGSFRRDSQRHRSCRKPAPAPVTNLLGCRLSNQTIGTSQENISHYSNEFLDIALELDEIVEKLYNLVPPQRHHQLSEEIKVLTQIVTSDPRRNAEEHDVTPIYD